LWKRGDSDPWKALPKLAGTGWNQRQRPFQQAARGLALQELLVFWARWNPREGKSICNKNKHCE
jgi:hypothetical protein